MSELILYTTEDGRSQIQRRADPQTVWLTPLEMAELFNASRGNVCRRGNKLWSCRALDENSVVKESLTTARGHADGATVKQSLTVEFDVVGKPTAQEFSAVGSAKPDVIRRRFLAGLHNLGTAYKPVVNAWAKYDNEGRSPILLEWGENP